MAKNCDVLKRPDFDPATAVLLARASQAAYEDGATTPNKVTITYNCTGETVKFNDTTI